MALFLLSLVAGMLTVLAPCILPLLPVVLAGSVADTQNRRRPFVIVASLAVSVFAFTFLLKVSTVFIGVPEVFWKYFAAVIITAFGLALVFPTLWEKLMSSLPFIHNSGNRLLAKGYQSGGSIWGDVAIGIALGPIFTTCSPTYFLVLATVLPVSFVTGALYIFAYILGLAIALLGIATLGQRLIAKLNWAANPQGWFKRGLGVLFILVAIAIATGYDKKLEASILDAGFFDITKLEQKISETLQGKPMNELPSTTTDNPMPSSFKKDIQGPYVEIKNPAGFVNSDPFELKDLIGKKVILLDFMTYSCINCQRTFPYLNDWYDNYKDQGLEIVGIHTPEFAFEKDRNNVIEAAGRFGLKFPLVLDNDYATWNAWGNRYWPHKYLIDIEGNVVYDHIGEGAYEETEAMIVQLLNERKQVLKEEGTVGMDEEQPEGVKTPSARSPETYFGAWRNDRIGNGQPFAATEKDFVLPESIVPNLYYLGGRWEIAREYAETKEANTHLKFTFDAKDVYIVAEAMQSIGMDVLIDGNPVTAEHAGEDVTDGTVQVNMSRLYHLYTSDEVSEHTLELIFKKSGVLIYAFTFG